MKPKANFGASSARQNFNGLSPYGGYSDMSALCPTASHFPPCSVLIVEDRYHFIIVVIGRIPKIKNSNRVLVVET